MKGLILDTPGSGPCTREQAFDERLIPASTNTYQAVPNEEMLLMLNDAARQKGLILTNEQLGMDFNGMRFFGTYDVEGMDFFDGKAKMMLGFCNSYNKSLRERTCFGGKVMVCSNLVFHAWADETSGVSGNVAHKHTANVNKGFWGRLMDSMNQVDIFRANQSKFYETLANKKITKDQAYATIIQAARQGIIGTPRMLDVADEWDRQERFPDTEAEYQVWHPEFKDRNAFNLLNAFTEVEKKRLEKNPVVSNIKTLDLTSFFHTEFVLN